MVEGHHAKLYIYEALRHFYRMLQSSAGSFRKNHENIRHQHNPLPKFGKEIYYRNNGE